MPLIFIFTFVSIPLFLKIHRLLYSQIFNNIEKFGREEECWVTSQYTYKVVLLLLTTHHSFVCWFLRGKKKMQRESWIYVVICFTLFFKFILWQFYAWMQWNMIILTSHTSPSSPSWSNSIPHTSNSASCSPCFP